MPTLLYEDRGFVSCDLPQREQIDEEYLPALHYETDPVKPISLSDVIKGRRIVNIAHLLKQYELVLMHKFSCTMGEMKPVKEMRVGLVSTLHFYCDNCEKRTFITTDNDESSLTMSFVWRCLSIGIGHSQAEEFMAVLNVPTITQNTFVKKTALVKNAWQDHLTKEMKQAGEQEKLMALDNGDVTDEGIPYITVIGDGGWSKRTYGHGYNSSSGVGIIIGSRTKKPLFLGIRNKYCSSCVFYKSKQLAPRPHECAMNFNGPSTAMEQDIIVEGFSKSIDQHGLMYKYYIGDGDSSVHAKIIERVSYGRKVIKIECANHMIRCVSDKLHKLATNTSYQLTNRKFLTSKVAGISRIERLVKGVRVAIKNAAKDNNVKQLQEDILNAPYHVFGRHTKCRVTFCQRKDVNEEDIIPIIEGDFLVEIKKILNPLIQKASRVAFNETTNLAERYMSLVAKCTGGKRINFTKRLSYTARAYAAAISHSRGSSWHLSAWHSLYKQMPGYYTRKVFERRQNISVKRKQILLENPPKKRRVPTGSTADSHYGPDVAQPDVTDEKLKIACERHLHKLSDRVPTIEKQEALQQQTIGQHENSRWVEIRKDCLTASNFGAVIKRRKTTSCHNFLKKLLYSQELNNSHVLYGRIHEKDAIRKYETLRNVRIAGCGIFLHVQHPYLGASPDGLVGDDGLVEVKCIPSIGTAKLIDSATTKTCFEIKDGRARLKLNHNYYFQVQGQLNITGREYCDFIIFTPMDYSVERIRRDEDLWERVMLPKLKMFYINCMLPEIVDGRIPRGMTARDPQYIMEAQRDAQEVKKHKK